MKQWSEGLKERTRKRLENHLDLFPGKGQLHFKSEKGGFAWMDEVDFFGGKLLLRLKGEDGFVLYPTVEELVAAGWVID